MTPAQVLHDISLANLTLYAAAAPAYDDKHDDWDDTIDANNPQNNTTTDDITDENETYV